MKEYITFKKKSIVDINALTPMQQVEKTPDNMAVGYII